MQSFKLVNAGFVDKVIVFDTLPTRFTENVKTRAADGFPRSWAKWLASIGSTRKVLKTETIMNPDRSYRFEYTPIGEEPCFFVLEYQDVNADKERWRQICDYLKQNCSEKVRLTEKIEDMARALAPNCHVALDVEPEDIPVIPVPSGIQDVVTDDMLVKQGEQIIVNETPAAPKKRGRPKKVAVSA